MKEMSEMKHLSDPFSSPITQENEKTKQTNLITILIISVNCVPFCECILLFLTWRDGPVFWMKKNNNTIHNFLLTLIHTWWSWNQMNLPCSHKKKKKKKKKENKGHQLCEQSWQSVPMIACWCQLVNEGVCLFVVLSAFSKLLAEFHLSPPCFRDLVDMPVMSFPQSQSSSLFARMKMTITVQTIDLIFLVKRKAIECVFVLSETECYVNTHELLFFVVSF